jgi:hypothetical protein
MSNYPKFKPGDFVMITRSDKIPKYYHGQVCRIISSSKDYSARYAHLGYMNEVELIKTSISEPCHYWSDYYLEKLPSDELARLLVFL